MSPIRLALIAPLALLISPLVFAQSQPATLPPDATQLQVSTHGESHRTPDVALISAGVVTENIDAKTAMRTNAQRMTAVVAALKQAGVADRDIQTSN
ncbi:MAG: SIMPL domain-containing protein, partial [Lysobacteraceae bacterium]